MAVPVECISTSWRVPRLNCANCSVYVCTYFEWSSTLYICQLAQVHNSIRVRIELFSHSLTWRHSNTENMPIAISDNHSQRIRKAAPVSNLFFTMAVSASPFLHDSRRLSTLVKATVSAGAWAYYGVHIPMYVGQVGRGFRSAGFIPSTDLEHCVCTKYEVQSSHIEYMGCAQIYKRDLAGLFKLLYIVRST